MVVVEVDEEAGFWGVTVDIARDGVRLWMGKKSRSQIPEGVYLGCGQQI